MSRPLPKSQQLAEYEQIRARRRAAFGMPAEDLMGAKQANESDSTLRDVVGLALSGGGIRSALFNDGMLRAFSHSGLLRYVDYLSCVSGGGYIVGHLLASGELKRCEDEAKQEERKAAEAVKHQSEYENKYAAESREVEVDCGQKSNERPSFHDVEDYYSMGKDPQSGQIERCRLPGAGGYLNKSIPLFMRYLANQLPMAAVYLGSTGLFACTVALIWRSLDTPEFRAADSALFRDFGGELGIAFYPTLFLASCWLTCLSIRKLLRWLKPLVRKRFHAEATSESKHLSPWFVEHALFYGCCISIPISLAIYSGNGLTDVGQQRDFNLNYFAELFAIIAAIVQVMVFLLRDRLFRSERSDASAWERLVVQAVSWGAIFCVVFAMVHWMGRENLSHFVNNRDPDLVRAEVLDWRPLLTLAGDYVVESGDVDAAKQMTELRTAMSRSEGHEYISVRPRSAWTHRESVAPLPVWKRASTPNDPPGPNEQYDQAAKPALGQASIPWRMVKLATRGIVSAVAACGSHPQERQREYWVPSNKSSDPLRRHLHLVGEQWKRQNDFVSWFNENLLQRPEFTRSLLKATGTVGARGEGTSSKMKELFKQQRELRPSEWSKSREARMLRDIHEFKSNQFAMMSPVRQRDAVAKLNRDLIDVLYPNAIRYSGIASTPVVVYHDQAARWQWMGIWACWLAVGVIGTWRLNRRLAIFRHYRTRLRDNFLVGWKRGGAAAIQDQNVGEMSVANLRPTSVGLPFPIYLAAYMDVKHGPEPLVVTNTHIARSDPAVSGAPVAEALVSYQKRTKQDIKLADVVAISGAALTPLMTSNYALRVILNVFGVRLGQYLPLPVNQQELADGEAAKQCERENVSWLSADWNLSVFYDWIRGTFGNSQHCPTSGFIADGGYVDNLGIQELLRRRCKLIIASDCAVNTGQNELGQLAKVLEESAANQGVQFLDLDHNGPIDVGRLTRDEQRLVPQPYICARIRYPKIPGQAAEQDCTGYLFYSQMAITETDPIEIRQIRKRFAKFPDEPTTNQFYTEEQVAAYRRLGYFIGKRICRELPRWSTDDIHAAISHLATQTETRAADEWRESSMSVPEFYGIAHDAAKPDTAGTKSPSAAIPCSRTQPLYSVVQRRLLSAFRLACFEEVSYKDNDVFSESLWDDDEWCFASFREAAEQVWPSQRTADTAGMARALPQADMCDKWISAYETNADVRAALRHAVFKDVNQSTVDLARPRSCSLELWKQLLGRPHDQAVPLSDHPLFAAHLCGLAVACHQMHRGTPHSLFKVGGRKKLIDLMVSIATASDVSQTFVNTSKKSKAASNDLARATHFLRKSCPEIIEMQHGVFHGAEHATVVSFFQILATHTHYFARSQSDWRFGPQAIVETASALEGNLVEDLEMVAHAAMNPMPRKK